MNRLHRLDQDFSRWLRAHPVPAVVVTAALLFVMTVSVPESVRADIDSAPAWVSWVALGFMVWTPVTLLVLPRAMGRPPGEALGVLWAVCVAPGVIGFGAVMSGAWSWLAGVGFMVSVVAMVAVMWWGRATS